MIADCRRIADIYPTGSACVDLIDQHGGWNHARAMAVITEPTGSPDLGFAMHIQVHASACVDQHGRWTGQGYRVSDAQQQFQGDLTGVVRDDCPPPSIPSHWWNPHARARQA